MAKSKHSPALFEVVHGKKQLDKRARTGALRTPSWWFKSRSRGSAGAVIADEPPSFVDDPTDPTYVRPVPQPAPETEPQPAFEPEPEVDPTEPAPAMIFPPSPGRRGTSGIDVRLDRDRQELFLRVRYTTAIVSGFALVVLIGLAYITGRHFARGPSGALAYQPTEEVAEGPIEKGVLQVGRSAPPSRSTGTTTGTGGLPTGADRPAPSRAVEAGVVAPLGTATPVPVSSQHLRPPGPLIEPKPGIVESPKRTIGLNYVIMQSYPKAEKHLADEAVQYLNRSGIPSTIEQPAGWNPNWYCVVGTTGFTRVSGREYDNYVEAVEKVNQQFAGKSRFKRLEPTPIKWK